MVDIHCDLCGKEASDLTEVAFRQTQPTIYYVRHFIQRALLHPTLRLCRECADELQGVIEEMAEKKRKQVDE